MFPALQLILLIFTSLSMAMYILIITLIVCYRRRIRILRNSFFILVLSYFVADLFYFSEFTLFMRCRKYGVFNTFLRPNTTLFTVLPIFSNSFHYYTKITIYIGQVVFASNRLTSALFVMHYEKYWTHGRIWIIRALQFTIPLIFVIPVCPIVNGILGTNFTSTYTIDNAANTVRLGNDPLSTKLIAYIDCACCATATVLCLVMYSITLWTLHAHQKHHKKSITGTEVRLLLSSLITFTIMAVNCAVQIMTILADDAGMESVYFVHDFSYPVNDLMYSCQPWALLLTSSVIRQRICGILTGAEKTQSSSAPLPTIMIHRAQ